MLVQAGINDISNSHHIYNYDLPPSHHPLLPLKWL